MRPSAVVQADDVLTHLLLGGRLRIQTRHDGQPSTAPPGDRKDSLWHLPWLKVPIVILACGTVMVILAVVVSWLQSLVARALGPNSALDELRPIGWLAPTLETSQD